MKWISNYKHPEGHTFEIEYELEIAITDHGPEDYPAYYLLGIDGNGYFLCNYMQEEFEAATEQAFMKWGVPEDSWVKVEE